MKTARPEQLVRSEPSPGTSEAFLFLTNYAPAGVTDQRGGAKATGAQEAQVNKCTFICKHKRTN